MAPTLAHMLASNDPSQNPFQDTLDLVGILGQRWSPSQTSLALNFQWAALGISEISPQQVLLLGDSPLKSEHSKQSWQVLTASGIRGQIPALVHLQQSQLNYNSRVETTRMEYIPYSTWL